jgi:hypothetical protein
VKQGIFTEKILAGQAKKAGKAGQSNEKRA